MDLIELSGDRDADRASLGIFCLFVAAHVLSKTIIERNGVAVAEIKRSHSQVIIAQDIIISAEALSVQAAEVPSSFNKNIARLEAGLRTDLSAYAHGAPSEPTATIKDDPLYQRICPSSLVSCVGSNWIGIDHQLGSWDYVVEPRHISVGCGCSVLEPFSLSNLALYAT